MSAPIRVIPHDDEAEAGVLGGVMSHNDWLRKLADLQVEDFYGPKHQAVFGAMRNLEATATPIDPITVEAGIVRTYRAIERQQVLVTREVWEAGLRVGDGRRSFARAIAGYVRDGKGEPVRDRGHDDVMDALRYAVRRVLWWGGHPTDGRMYSGADADVALRTTSAGHIDMR